ncbi:MAG: divergent PAP2 family protein [Candidatus Nanoarchaeia archaeon]
MTPELVIILTVAVTWLCVQVFKHIDHSGKPKFSFFVSGGMPSSHTATATSLVTMIILVEGLTTTAILAGFLLLIIIRDAVGVRLATGRNASVLQSILPKKRQSEVMLERGHTTIQVIVGFIVGLVFAVASYWIFLF